MGYVLAEDGTAPASDSVDIPGRPLVLTRGEATAVTVVNRLREPTAVHWHGLELESYSDGMADGAAWDHGSRLRRGARLVIAHFSSRGGTPCT
jgi:hypothetical protein